MSRLGATCMNDNKKSVCEYQACYTIEVYLKIGTNRIAPMELHKAKLHQMELHLNRIPPNRSAPKWDSTVQYQCNP